MAPKIVPKKVYTPGSKPVNQLRGVIKNRGRPKIRKVHIGRPKNKVHVGTARNINYRSKYTQVEMERAVIAVNADMSFAAASKKFGVPRITLNDRVCKTKA